MTDLKLGLIKAYENTYSGTDGLIKYATAMYKDDISELSDLAVDMSYEIMGELEIIDHIIWEYEQEFGDEAQSYMEEYLEEELADNVAYMLYPINLPATEENLFYAEKMVNHNPDDFIERFCGKPQ